MSAVSWSIPAIPRAARSQAAPTPRRVRLARGGVLVARAGAAEVPVADSGEAAVVFSEKFPLRRCQTVEGKAWVRVEAEPDADGKCKVVIGCDVEGKWLLHWGVSYHGETGSEWDQPPSEIRPPGSVPIKDSAIETPLETSPNSEGHIVHEVQIKFDKDTPIAAINFVLKEEGTGAWFQHKGGDFRIPLSGSLEDGDPLGVKQGIDVYPGYFRASSTLSYSSGFRLDINYFSSTEVLNNTHLFGIRTLSNVKGNFRCNHWLSLPATMNYRVADEFA